jgi:hypothetical protein
VTAGIQWCVSCVCGCVCVWYSVCARTHVRARVSVCARNVTVRAKRSMHVLCGTLVAVAARVYVHTHKQTQHTHTHTHTHTHSETSETKAPTRNHDTRTRGKTSALRARSMDSVLRLLGVWRHTGVRAGFSRAAQGSVEATTAHSLSVYNYNAHERQLYCNARQQNPPGSLPTQHSGAKWSRSWRLVNRP